MVKKLQKAEYKGQLRMVTYLGVQHGTAAIIQPRSLYFWPENQPENMLVYDLSGCEEQGGLDRNGFDLILTNSSKKKVELRLFNVEQI